MFIYNYICRFSLFCGSFICRLRRSWRSSVSRGGRSYLIYYNIGGGRSGCRLALSLMTISRGGRGSCSLVRVSDCRRLSLADDHQQAAAVVLSRQGVGGRGQSSAAGRRRGARGVQMVSRSASSSAVSSRAGGRARQDRRGGVLHGVGGRALARQVLGGVSALSR